MRKLVKFFWLEGVIIFLSSGIFNASKHAAASTKSVASHSTEAEQSSAAASTPFVDDYLDNGYFKFAPSARYCRRLSSVR